MRQRKFKESTGVTLLELTFAMAIFAGAMGATAQALVSYYSALEVQGRRATAIEHCRTVIGALREVRNNASGEFVTDVVNWVSEQESPSGEGSSYGELFESMDDETVTTTLTALDGGAPADPMLVTVQSQFTDMYGRPVTLEVSTVLTRGN